MPLLICSGVNRPDLLDLLAKERVAGMVNAAEVCQPKLWRACLRYPDIPLFLDSGAFQGKMEFATYQAIIERVGQRFTWIANLDVIGDQAQSNDHYRSLMHALPCSLREKILWVYQGGDVRELAERAHEHKFVGLGGIVRLLAEQGTERALTYLMTLGEVLLDAGAQAHIFGLGSPYLLGRLGSAPWFRSFDTSKWLLAYKARAVLLENGERRSAAQLGLRLNSGECACNNIRQLHMWANPRVESKPMLSLWEDSDTIDF